MKRTVLIYGLIAGAIIVFLWFITTSLWIDADGKMDFAKGTMFGYINMILALSMIFFGVRQFRDRYLEGKITFGKAFWVGFLIALVAGVIYVVGWMVYYHNSALAQTFASQYIEHWQSKMVEAGKSAEEIANMTAKYERNFELYNRNPFVMAGMTLMEILPVGILISLISAFILRRK